MPLEKLLEFTKKVADLADKPNATMSAAEVKAQFDAAPNEVRVYLNQLIDKLQSVEDGDSGADNIGVTSIDGLIGDSVQELLESLKNLDDTNRAYLLSQIQTAVLGQIPDGTVTDAKLSDAEGQIKQDFAAHQAKDVSQGEVHGLRATNGKLEYYDGVEWKTVSGGLPVGNVSNFDAKSGNAEVTLTWTDPTDVTLDGATLAEWAGTKILRKTGGFPANENDGVLVVDSGVRNQYDTNGFVDVGLSNGTTYYYSAFPYTTEDIYDKKSDSQATPQPYHIYGVKIDTTNSNPETAVTYTDDAVGLTPASGNNGTFNYGSWADKFPFNQIKPCVFLNGAVNYYLDPNDYTKKEDGVTASDITTGADGDVMVEFPKIWWKLERVGSDLYVRYADAQIDTSYKPLAHTRGSTEKDKIYVSAYLGYSSGGKLRSLSGKTPTASKTIGAFRVEAQSNGEGYEQMPFYPLTMLQILALIMFKNMDAQSALGRGFVDGNSAATSTGGANAKGMFFGETTGKLQNKFCGVEDFYGNLRYWIDGVFYDSNYNVLIGDDGYNDTGNGYTNYGATGWTSSSGGYIDDVQGATETGFIPASTNGSETTYYADYGYIGSDRLPHFGGSWSGGSNAGSFHLYSNAASSSISAIGARACFV